MSVLLALPSPFCFLDCIDEANYQAMNYPMQRSVWNRTEGGLQPMVRTWDTQTTNLFRTESCGQPHASLRSGSFPVKPFSSVQFSSVAQSCPTLCNTMNLSTPGLPVHHQLPEITQTPVHRVSDAIQPSHPLSSPSPPAPNPSQHHSLFQWVNSSHKVAKVLEFQL